MKIRSNKLLTVSFIILLSTLLGCAATMARSDRDPPDLSKVVKGADRAVVEAELGGPVRDIRAPFGSGADRKVLYHYYTRDSMESDDPGTMEKFRNYTMGFTRHQLYVYYNPLKKVVRTTRPKKKIKR